MASRRRQKAWIVITQARSVARAAASSSSPQRVVARPRAPARAARQLGADPRAHLGGGALGEGEGEDAVDPDAVLDDRVAVAVDQHGRLAGAGAGLEEGVAVAGRDRGGLLGRWVGAGPGDVDRLRLRGVELEVGE